MQPFPNEHERAQEVREELNAEFDFAERLYHYWLGTGRRKHEYLAKIPDQVLLNVLTQLNVQACREYRAIVELCGRSEAHAATSITRSLYETTLALAFVATPEVRVRVVKSRKNRYVATLPPDNATDDPSSMPSRELRALLYSFNIILEPEIYRLKLKNKQGRENFANSYPLDSQLIAELEKRVGEEWTEILRSQPWTYSGLNVADLSKAVGHNLDVWYDVIYPLHSKIAHGARGIDHLTVKDGELRIQWLSPIEHVRSTLGAARGLFLLGIDILVESFDFGEETTAGIIEFEQQHVALVEGNAGQT